MANTDSFVEEVSDEVRRDKLFALMKRWGWVAVVAVVAIVGGAAYLELSSSRQQAEAEAFGDAVITALDGEDTDARIAALQDVDTPTVDSEVIVALLAAAEASSAEDPTEAAARLREVAATPDLPRRYADLALLKAEMLSPGPEDESRQILQALAVPGAPYAALAEEQLALIDIRSGDVDAGLDRLRGIERSAQATAGLQQRAAQLIVALESGATLIDTAPEPVVEEDETPEAATPVEGDDAANATAEDAAPAEAAPVADDEPDAADAATADDTAGDGDAADADGADEDADGDAPETETEAEADTQ